MNDHRLLREERNVERIKAYWAARGYQVKTWIEATTADDGNIVAPLYSIRSDMIGGLPRDYILQRD